MAKCVDAPRGSVLALTLDPKALPPLRRPAAGSGLAPWFSRQEEVTVRLLHLAASHHPQAPCHLATVSAERPALSEIPLLPITAAARHRPASYRISCSVSVDA